MSLKCIAKSILYDIDYWDISITKIKAIRKLCEKQIPKAIEFDDNDLNICPVCKEHVETDDKYFWNCGQGIILNINKED